MEQETTYIDRVLARAVDEPDAEIVRDRDGGLTAAQFTELVWRLARALEARGLGRGARVAMLVPNRRESLALRYAAAAVGCASVFCPNRGPAALKAFLEQVAPTLLIVFPQTAEAARPLRWPWASVGPVAGIDVDLLAAADEFPADPFEVRARPKDLAYLVPSGGTTGLQKASRLTFATYERMIDAGRQPDRRQLVCMPLAYVSQIHAEQTLLGGGSVVLTDGPDAATVLATIESHRITHLGVVEPFLVELVDHPDVERRDLSSLRALAHIGANAPASLRRRLLERVGSVLVHPYGASEVGLVSILAAPDYGVKHAELLGSVGRPLPGIEVEIERPDGTPATVDEVGAVVVRSPTQAAGYLRAPSTSGFSDDGYRTGDLGRIDRHGYLHVRGRALDARTIGEQVVMPLDIEDALCAHPDVRYAVALPDAAPSGGFAAFVLRDPGARTEATELMAHVRDRAGATAVPGAVIFVERMPTTEQGKPDRHALGELIKTAT